jgi:hypothetical protein
MAPSSATLTISLLHASFHRPGGPSEVIDAWLNSAGDSHRIDYVLACDDGDVTAATVDAVDPRVRLVVNPPDRSWSTAVRNWNAAAAASTGDILVVIADDLHPPPLWDVELDRICASLDPRAVAFAVKVQDSDNGRDTLLRHPVVSRRFFESHGLFDPRFTGVYCDDDITLRAFWRAVVVDGRRLRWDHRHPALRPLATSTPSHQRINRGVEYDRGRAVLAAIWPTWRRHIPVVLVSPTAFVDRPWHRVARRAKYRAFLQAVTKTGRWVARQIGRVSPRRLRARRSGE